jgi:hypothetical protein
MEAAIASVLGFLGIGLIQSHLPGRISVPTGTSLLH